MVITDPQLKSSANIQPQSSAQALQPAATAPTGVVSSLVTTARPRFRWIHAAYAVGFLAVSGAGTAVLLKVLRDNLILVTPFKVDTLVPKLHMLALQGILRL